MLADHEHGTEENGAEAKKIPDFAQVIKELYFQSEEVWTRTIKEFVGSPSFVPLLEQISGQYLSLYKATNQNMDRYFANYPMATKKDIARVAELVVSVEDKVDQLETQISNTMSSLAASLIKLVEYQATIKDEILVLRNDVSLLQDKLNREAGNEQLLITPADLESDGTKAPIDKGKRAVKTKVPVEEPSILEPRDEKSANKPNPRKRKELPEGTPGASTMAKESINSTKTLTGRQKRSSKISQNE